MPLPEFRADGYLPTGLHKATQVEVAARFGTGSPRREYLMNRVARWLTECRVVGVRRFLVNGSFVTSKIEPGDVDCVCWLPRDFKQQYEWGRLEAVELYHSLRDQLPEEIYSAESQNEWDEWVEFFSQIRGQPEGRKGLVEVFL